MPESFMVLETAIRQFAQLWFDWTQSTDTVWH